MNADALTVEAPCPKCRTEMIYVTALPHPKSPQMRKTTFVCYGCNQTRTYSLSAEMAAAYALICSPDGRSEEVGCPGDSALPQG